MTRYRLHAAGRRLRAAGFTTRTIAGPRTIARRTDGTLRLVAILDPRPHYSLAVAYHLPPPANADAVLGRPVMPASPSDAVDAILAMAEGSR